VGSKREGGVTILGLVEKETNDITSMPSGYKIPAVLENRAIIFKSE